MAAGVSMGLLPRSRILTLPAWLGAHSVAQAEVRLRQPTVGLRQVTRDPHPLLQKPGLLQAPHGLVPRLFSQIQEGLLAENQGPLGRAQIVLPHAVPDRIQHGTRLRPPAPLKEDLGGRDLRQDQGDDQSQPLGQGHRRCDLLLGLVESAGEQQEVGQVVPRADDGRPVVLPCLRCAMDCLREDGSAIRSSSAPASRSVSRGGSGSSRISRYGCG